MARQDKGWHCRHGEEKPGEARSGAAGYGRASQAWRGLDR